jgi:uncharacterized protein with ParB-like and HNH nuclease domain
MKTNVQYSLLQWIRLIQEDSRYYFVKAVDIFYELPDIHQKNIIEFFADEAEQEIWKDSALDSTKYLDVIRNILFYYSGKEKLQHPNKKVFASLLAKYLKSERCKQALEVKIKSKRAFAEGLKAL